MQTKKCGKCLEEKPFDAYSNNTPTRKHSWCKQCTNAYCKEHYKRNRQKYLERNKKHQKKLLKLVNELKSVPCAICGKSFPPAAMDFDHRDPATKICNINELVSKRGSTKKLLEEIAKCDVLCACCHRIRHFSS